MTEPSPIELIFTPNFQTQLRRLAKRYRNVRADLKPLFDELESGNCPGDQISGTTYTVFKVRVKNRDIQKGKSSGYRVIYQRRDSICILLITLYSKSDESTLAAREILEIIDAFNKLNEPSDQGTQAMKVTIDIPDPLCQILINQAAQMQITPEQLIIQILNQHFQPATATTDTD